MATHSKADPLEMMKKFFRSGFVNLPVPSAILSKILKDARRNWSLVVLSSFVESKKWFIRMLNSLALL